MAPVQIARQLLENDMKIFSIRSFAGPQAPGVAVALDVVRIVITAVLAGTGFALLLALAVLSLTVIAPPARASGAPVLTSAEPAQTTRAFSEKPGVQSGAISQGEAFAAQALPGNVPQVRSNEGVPGSKPGMPAAAGWSLILALLAGALAFIVYLRRKA
jgi:hypothetical protein